MSDLINKTNLPIFNPLPAVIPPTSRFNLVKNWWQRSEKTSSIAEARIIQRIYDALPNQTIGIPTYARIGRISIDKTAVSNKLARQVNTLYISQQATQQQAFQFESEPAEHLEEIIQKETAASGQQGIKNLVMCHGYGAGLGFFYRNFQSLSQVPGWRLFAIDWLGMGNSSRPKWSISRKSNETWDEIVSDVEDHFVTSLEDWRAKTGLDKMTLLGHSLGGYFATCYALKYPEHVEKLILVSPAGIPENTLVQEAKVADSNPSETLEREASAIGASQQAEAEVAENVVKGQQKRNSIPPNTDEEPAAPRRRIPAWATYLWDRNVTPMSIVRMIGPFGPSMVNLYSSRRFAHLEEGERHDLYDYLYHITSSSGSGEYALAAILAPGAYARKPLFHRLADLKVPTVFIYGENDWMDYKAAMKAKDSMSVPAKIIRVPDGGHHMYLDNPEYFNKAVKKEMKP